MSSFWGVTDLPILLALQIIRRVQNDVNTNLLRMPVFKNEALTCAYMAFVYVMSLNPVLIIFSVRCLHAHRKTRIFTSPCTWLLILASQFLIALILFAPATFINYSTSHCSWLNLRKMRPLWRLRCTNTQFTTFRAEILNMSSALSLSTLQQEKWVKMCSHDW